MEEKRRLQLLKQDRGQKRVLCHNPVRNICQICNQKKWGIGLETVKPKQRYAICYDCIINKINFSKDCKKAANELIASIEKGEKSRNDGPKQMVSMLDASKKEESKDSKGNEPDRSRDLSEFDRC